MWKRNGFGLRQNVSRMYHSISNPTTLTVYLAKKLQMSREIRLFCNSGASYRSLVLSLWFGVNVRFYWWVFFVICKDFVFKFLSYAAIWNSSWWFFSVLFATDKCSSTPNSFWLVRWWFSYMMTQCLNSYTAEMYLRDIADTWLVRILGEILHNIPESLRISDVGTLELIDRIFEV
jgi:hypothetical protein